MILRPGHGFSIQKLIGLFTILAFFQQAAIGQVNLHGCVTNTKGDALPRINIMVYQPGYHSIIAFAVSDEKGNFTIKATADSDSLIIKVSSVNFTDMSRTIHNSSQNLKFELAEEIKNLTGVTVLASPIEKHGDTLSYLVKSFTRLEDRSIEDVLRRMPGIEVENSGQILYQGTPINKFYVEGLDLMEGRYSLVSKNLPQGSVTVVEILENHQPLRMLEGKVESQQAALNLKIKKGITTTGTAQLGTGFSPFLREVNVTPMTFTKKFQFVTSFQTNNTGNDAAQQLEVFTPDDFKSIIERPSGHIGMLNILSASPPNIKPNRYLDNDIFLFNFNGLQHMSKDFTLRSNICYTSDNQRAHTSILRRLYTPDDTLQFREQSDNKLTTHNLYANFSITRNVKKNYLKDDLKIQGGWDRQTGIVTEEGKSLAQSLRTPVRSITNEFRLYNPIGKHIWEFQSLVSYDQNPQSLGVRPGQFEDELNNGEPYDFVMQEIDLKRLYTDNSAGFVLIVKQLTFSPRLGVTYQQQTLLSNLNMQDYNEETTAASEFANDIVTKSAQTWLMTDIEYKTEKLKFKGTLSLNRHQVDIKNHQSGRDQNIARLLPGNRISIDYRIYGFWRIIGSWEYKQRINNFDEHYSGFIMNNYRSLSKNIEPLSTVSTHRFFSRLEYRNQITAFFNTLNYVYSISHSNNTINNLIFDNGSSVAMNQYLPKTSYTHYIQAYSSKYSTSLKTTFSLHANYIQQQGKSLVNNQSFTTKNRFIIISPELSIHLTPWMNLDYNISANSIFNYIDNAQKSRMTLAKHNINFFIFPVKNQLVSLSAEYYKHNSTNNLFVDLLYRYTITKRKIDIEVKCNNIFNSQTYISYLSGDFSVWETSIQLRPFQAILSVKLNF